jgi:hypothetical protein
LPGTPVEAAEWPADVGDLGEGVRQRHRDARQAEESGHEPSHDFGVSLSGPSAWSPGPVSPYLRTGVLGTVWLSRNYPTPLPSTPIA